MDSWIGENIAKAVAAVAAGLLTFGVIARKALTGFSQEAAAAGRAEAEASLIGNLRSELERLAQQNGILASRLNELQLTVADLHKDISTQRAENSSLKAEVIALHSEITHLRADRAAAAAKGV